jgi:dolichol-phosphate mannosyltransferase
MNKSLSVVIPTFNEKENIQILVPRILEVFGKNNINGEVVIVEDPSTDGSAEVLRSLESRHSAVRVIFRKPPGSLSKAWHEGFEAAEKEHVVCIDADLCHDPAVFPEMLSKMETFDLVIGSRYLDSGTAKMEDKSLLAILCSRFGQISSRLVFGFKETDTSHSFRMFKKELFNRIANRLDQEGNVYLIQFLYEAEKAGAKVTEVPIVYGKRIHGETKLKVTKETVRYFKFVFRTLGRKLTGRC